MHSLGDVVSLNAHPVDSIADADAIGHRLDVNVAGPHVDRLVDEHGHQADDGCGVFVEFLVLADVARQWEQSVREAESIGVRVATIRLGVVLGAHGGAMSRLIPPFRFFVGGHPGSGRQWLPWVHVNDVIGVVRFLIESADCKGPFNVTAPDPIRSKDFYSLLGKAMHRPACFPMPAFALKLALGEMATELLLSSTRVIPKKLLEAGYDFRFCDPAAAFSDILKGHET